MTEPIKVVGQILRDEMLLDADHVMLQNQENIIPKTGLYVVLGYASPSKVLSSSSRSTSTDMGMLEEQSVSMQHMIQVDIMAFNDPEGGNEARARKEEVIMALTSNRAQELMSLNSIQIARNPGPIIDTSDLEGSARMHRYTMMVSVLAVHNKSKSAPYYDSFKGQLHPDLRTEPYFDEIQPKELINE